MFGIGCSIELFQKMCDELKDWIGEKQGAVNNADLGKDANSVDALRRKHQVRFYWRDFWHFATFSSGFVFRSNSSQLFLVQLSSQFFLIDFLCEEIEIQRGGKNRE